MTLINPGLMTLINDTWQSFRQMLANSYNDLTVLSIAANGKDMSFSSDTGMAECLVIARKNDGAGFKSAPTPYVHFTSLRRRPQGFADASAIAKYIVDAGDIRGIEDGPYGGTPLEVGDDIVGEMLSAPQTYDGKNWGAVRLMDYSLVQFAYALAQCKLWLPGNLTAPEFSVNSLREFGNLGFHHLDITGLPAVGPP